MRIILFSYAPKTEIKKIEENFRGKFQLDIN